MAELAAAAVDEVDDQDREPHSGGTRAARAALRAASNWITAFIESM